MNNSVYNGGEQDDEFSYKNDNFYISNNFESVRQETKLSSSLSITIASNLPTIFIDFKDILSFDPIKNIDKLEKVELYDQKELKKITKENLEENCTKENKS